MRRTRSLGVLVLALCLGGEEVGQVMTLVVSAEEEERVRVTDLERSKAEQTLHTSMPSG